MKKILGILILSSAVFAVNSFAETVYINGKPVDQKIINQTINQFVKSSPMAASQVNNPKFKHQILQSIGMQQAILMEGNKEGLDKTAEYQEKLQEVKPMIYAQILQEKSASKVTDAEVKAKYAEMVKQAANAKQYEISHILVKDEATANKIIAELKKGASFAALAKKYSIDPGSKAKGGDLGWSDGSNYVPAFTQAAEALKKGQYTTTPVKTQFGYHIIKLNDEKVGSANKLAPYAKMEAQIRQQIQMDKTRAFFDNIKTQYKVEVK